MPKDVRALLESIADGAEHDAEGLELLIAEKTETMSEAQIGLIRTAQSFCGLHAKALRSIIKAVK